MEFIRAEKLVKEFEVKGSFYNVKIKGEIFECRNYAQVYRKSAQNHSSYNAIFVLINPGLCSPKVSTYKIPQVMGGKGLENYTFAKTDNTQYQIMRFMQLKHWDKVLLINLSDIRAGNLSEFSHKLRDARKVGFESHSLFSNQRREELNHILALCDGPIVLAWGTDSSIRNLAKEALKVLPIEKIVGVKHKNRPYYYHASPTPLDGKIKWLEQMNEEIS